MLGSDNWGLLDNWATAKVKTRENKIVWTPCYSKIDLNQIELDPDSFLKYRTDAAKRIAASLGPRPVLAVSGGADSQAMVQSFVEAGIDFRAATLVFKDNLNSHDVDYARQLGLDLEIVELDVMKFLHHSLWDYADKYQCSSPQFSCHNWFYEQLIKLGYTGIVCGGFTWIPLTDGRWHWGNTGSRHSWHNFSLVNNFPLHGNFLASTWQLNFALAACTDPESFDHNYVDFNQAGELATHLISETYVNKLRAFKTFGFNIVPQPNKYTGFEQVKDYFIKASNDYWVFEKRFRWPIWEKWPELHSILDLAPEFIVDLQNLYNKASTARLDT